jgi:hypothetical protein
MQEEMRRHFEAGIEVACCNATNDARPALPAAGTSGGPAGKFEQAASQKERRHLRPMPKLYETTVTSFRTSPRCSAC